MYCDDSEEAGTICNCNGNCHFRWMLVRCDKSRDDFCSDSDPLPSVAMYSQPYVKNNPVDNPNYWPHKIFPWSYTDDDGTRIDTDDIKVTLAGQRGQSQIISKFCCC